jgi:hypothetical protein
MIEKYAVVRGSEGDLEGGASRAKLDREGVRSKTPCGVVVAELAAPPTLE